MKSCVIASWAAMLMIGCAEHAKQGSGGSALPENPAWAVAEPKRTAAIVAGALQYCTEMRAPIAAISGCTAVPLGQLELVNQRLIEPIRYLDREPLCIFATTGKASTGDEYFSVAAFSLSREVDQVQILARDPNLETIVLSIRLRRASKSLEAIWSQYFVVERHDWDVFRGRFRTDSSRKIVIDWSEGVVIPLPMGPNTELCVNVVDLSAGPSTWIPVCPFDYPE